MSETFTAAELADPEFFQANRSAIFRALREGRIAPETAYRIDGSQALTAAVGAALSGALTTTPAAPEEPRPGTQPRPGLNTWDMRLQDRRAFGLG